MNNNEKQISWQGIFKGIMQQEKDALKAEDLAYAIHGRLQEKYPLEEQPMQNNSKPMQTTQRMGEKQKPTRCPQCGKMSLYNNKGISKRSGAPYENVKCANKDCGFIEWKTMNYEQHRQADIIKSMHDDSNYEANQQENEEYPNFNERDR